MHLTKQPVLIFLLDINILFLSEILLPCCCKVFEGVDKFIVLSVTNGL